MSTRARVVPGDPDHMFAVEDDGSVWRFGNQTEAGVIYKNGAIGDYQWRWVKLCDMSTRSIDEAVSGHPDFGR